MTETNYSRKEMEPLCSVSSKGRSFYRDIEGQTTYAKGEQLQAL